MILLTVDEEVANLAAILINEEFPQRQMKWADDTLPQV
jgi:hypothetical protein